MGKIFFFKDMINIHMDEKAISFLETHPDHKKVFNKLIIGQNLIDFQVIKDVSDYIMTLSDDEIREVTLKDVTDKVGHIYDISGNVD